PATLEPVVREGIEHPVCLGETAHEGNHDDDVVETNLLARAYDGLAFECKAVFVAIAVVPARASKAQHRVFFVRLERCPADELRVLVALEVAQTNDDRIVIL